GGALRAGDAPSPPGAHRRRRRRRMAPPRRRRWRRTDRAAVAPPRSDRSDRPRSTGRSPGCVSGCACDDDDGGFGPRLIGLRMLPYLRAVLAGLVCLVGAGPVLAPPASATLSGEVRDESGAPVAGAAIIATATVDAATAETRSDAAGRFVLEGLAPGRYAIVAERQGLLPAVVPDIVLGPGAARALTLVLRVPGISEIVSVGAAQAAPEASPSTIAIAPRAVMNVAGAADNVFRVLQTLPGVAAVNDFDSRLTV